MVQTWIGRAPEGTGFQVLDLPSSPTSSQLPARPALSPGPGTEGGGGGLLEGCGQGQGAGLNCKGRALLEEQARGPWGLLTLLHRAHGFLADCHAQHTPHGLGLLWGAPIVGLLHAAVALRSWGEGRGGPLLEPPAPPLRRAPLPLPWLSGPEDPIAQPFPGQE